MNSDAENNRRQAMSATVSMVKCACSDCICVVSVDKAIEKEGRIFCSDECADHHKAGTGCHHAGCTCHG
jgi:metallothionein